jgi:hypothetical protein
MTDKDFYNKYEIKLKDSKPKKHSSFTLSSSKEVEPKQELE